MLRFSFRQGVGIDIEYNEEICYIAVGEDGREMLLGFNGMIIKLPFIQIDWGDVFELELNQKWKITNQEFPSSLRKVIMGSTKDTWETNIIPILNEERNGSGVLTGPILKT